MDGDEWKYADAGAQQATPADIIKFKHTKARLLVQLAWNVTPHEMQVRDYLNEGTVVKLGTPMNTQKALIFGDSANWVYTSQVQIIAIMPDLPSEEELLKKYKALTKKEKAKAKVVKEACQTEAEKWNEEVNQEGQWFDFGEGSQE